MRSGCYALQQNQSAVVHSRIFTTRRYASEAYAMALCPSVSVCAGLCASVTSWSSIETAEQLELVSAPAFPSIKEILLPAQYSILNKSPFLRKFVPNFRTASKMTLYCDEWGVKLYFNQPTRTLDLNISLRKVDGAVNKTRQRSITRSTRRIRANIVYFTSVDCHRLTP